MPISAITSTLYEKWFLNKLLISKSFTPFNFVILFGFKAFLFDEIKTCLQKQIILIYENILFTDNSAMARLRDIQVKRDSGGSP